MGHPDCLPTLDGWVKYYTPKMRGGDKKQARVLLEDALTKLEIKPVSSTLPKWGKRGMSGIIKKL